MDITVLYIYQIRCSEFQIDKKQEKIERKKKLTFLAYGSIRFLNYNFIIYHCSSLSIEMGIARKRASDFPQDIVLIDAQLDIKYHVEI